MNFFCKSGQGSGSDGARRALRLRRSRRSETVEAAPQGRLALRANLPSGGVPPLFAQRPVPSAYLQTLGMCKPISRRGKQAAEEDIMIKITPDFPCIHCGACAEACRHGVIKMVPNAEGKLVPKISFSSCRYCRACRWACPVIPREEV